MLGFAAVNTGNNLLFLIVAGLLAFMSVTGLAGMYNIKKMIPDLHPPDEVYAGIPAPFRLSVQNTKHYLPSFLIRVEYQAGQSLVCAVVVQDSTSDGTVMITFNQRGQEPLGKVTISSPYPVGFFTRYWSFEINSLVTVFPRPIVADSSGSGDDAPVTGAGLQRNRGISGELERIYPYSGSEPLRMIHWKHSARSNDLLVKGFGRSVVTPLVIDLDALSGAGVEDRLSQAAWLIQRWVRGRPVGMLLGGRILSTGIGKLHGLMLLKELALYGKN